jgi:hypothetical protein
MTCPRCFSQLDGPRGVCPECGVSLYHNVSGIVKTSVVMISAGDENVFYDSVQDVPELLRKQLIETTAGANSGTIVIADRAGKEQLTQVLARRDSMRERNQGVAPSIAQRPEEHQTAQPSLRDEHSWQGLPWIAWAGFGLVLAAAAGISAFFGLHW